MVRWQFSQQLVAESEMCEHHHSWQHTLELQAYGAMEPCPFCPAQAY